MREILFRGKRLDNGEWVEGWYQPPVSWGGNSWGTAIAFHHPTEGWLEDTEVDPATVCQYTGLTDKNGKKIFEGDIVDASETGWALCGPAGRFSPVIPVKWACDICGFDPFADYDRDCGVYTYGNKVEVIGNIHDNPELLEEVKSNAEV